MLNDAAHKALGKIDQDSALAGELKKLDVEAVR